MTARGGPMDLPWRRPWCGRRFAVNGALHIPSAHMTLDDLRAEVEAGRIDTVLLCLTDMQGRLQGKRMNAGFFLDEVAAHGAEACNSLQAVDVEMNTVEAYAMSSWSR